MATPIGDTPVLYGDDATEFLNKIGRPLSDKEKKLQKERREQRFVPF